MQILLLLRNVDGVGPTLTFSLPSEGGKMLFGVFVPRDISSVCSLSFYSEKQFSVLHSIFSRAVSDLFFHSYCYVSSQSSLEELSHPD